MVYLHTGYILNGRYKVIDIIGRGGQGAVYKVSDIHVFDKVCAAKEIIANISDDMEALVQFKKEAVFLSSLDHEGLPKITDFFKENKKYYIIMEYIEGKNLEEILDTYPDFFTEPRTIFIAVMLCNILNYTHNLMPNPIIFRDLKPANIIFNRNKIKLVDFGTARFFDANKKADTFHFGTIGYAPPEQYGGLTDTRSDIYSFGITLYHLLTKRDPRDGDSIPASGVSIRRFNKSYSSELDKIIKKMTMKNPKERYKDVKKIKEHLLKCSSIKMCPKCGKINSSRKARCFQCKSSLEYYSSDIISDTYQLICTNGSNKIFEFSKSLLTIGRNPGNDVVINIASVSRNHAVLKKEKNGFFIADLGSKSGTYIKTGRILKKIKKNLIKPGWKIRFGSDVEFIFKKKEPLYK